mmetsp:Transcript_3159/g.3574  ORF Transcript_3159/g.3574 Transcript_3159/m.3574 type:complete len:348 (+) Transcript_3159:78-1121(+)
MLFSRRTSLSFLYYGVSSITPKAATALSRMASSDTATSSIRGKTLITVDDAIQKSHNSNVKFIDGSWWLGGERNGRKEFEAGPRIANARFLDIDDISTTSDNLPHMMPSSLLQSKYMDAMVISENDHVIVYGAQDCMFITRAYWQMKTMHPRGLCQLLDGSLQDWIDANGPVEAKGRPSYSVVDSDNLTKNKTKTIYKATNAQNVIDMEELQTLIAEGKTVDKDSGVLVVDARSPERFSGEVEEPRPGLRRGHMPGAKNLFFLDLLDPNNKNKFKPKQELKRIIQEAGITLPLCPGSKIISSCGSGVTACALLTALDILDEDPSYTYLYDGAWAQWGNQPDTAITKE